MPPPTRQQSIGDWDWWLQQTFSPGTPVKTLRTMAFWSDLPDESWNPYGWTRLPRGARARIVGEPKFTGGDWRLPVEIVDARDEVGYQRDELIGKHGWVSVDIEDGEFWGLEPLEDRWPRKSRRRTSRHALPRSQRSWLKPNVIPMAPRDPYSTRQTPQYLAWVERTFSPGTPVRFMKSYMTYSEAGKLLDISPGAEGSVVRTDDHPEIVQVWLDSSDTYEHPCIAAIDTEFESIETILQPLQDNWELDEEAPTERRHQSFLQLKANGFADDQKAIVRRLNDAKSLARLLKKAGTSAENAADRIAAKYELSDQELRHVLHAVWGRLDPNLPAEYGAKSGAPVNQPRIGMVVTDGTRSAAGELRVGAITEVDRPRMGDVRVRWRGEAPSVVRRRDITRVDYDMARNPGAGMGVQVGDVLELERHPVYDHPGQTPSYKVTKRKVKWIEWNDGFALVRLVGARQRGAYGYVDKVYRLAGSEERGWWLTSTQPPSRYSVLAVEKKSRRARKKKR